MVSSPSTKKKRRAQLKNKQMSAAVSSTLAPDLAHLVNNQQIKWVFVGGKGGVGKTTTSCSLSIQFAKQRAASGQKVLLISTDPAHNLSDAFQQKILDQPTQIDGVPNLFAMETDPASEMNKIDASLSDLPAGAAPADANNNPMKMLKDLAKNMPGIDEAMSFNELMNQVKSMEYSVVVFDTAPTGHTLRLLQMPTALEDAMNTFAGGGAGGLGSMMQAVQSMMGGQADQMRAAKEKVKEVSAIFKDSQRTTFVCVCIPEFLSVYETERLIQELAKNEIDCSNVVVNQVLYPENENCGLCSARSKMQSKYLGQIDELYEDFHVVKMPLLHEEVRGVKALTAFSENLVSQYRPKPATK